MDHHRLRKYRGPETWTRVKAAYVAGEPAPSVARRFDVGLSNLRRRAMAEGWTRNRIAEALDLKPVRGGTDDPGPGLAPLPASTSPADAEGPPWIDPDVAVTRAVRRAAWLVSEGRAVEARALIRAAEALKQLDVHRGTDEFRPRPQAR